MGKNFGFVTAQHFKQVNDEDIAQKLFKASVKMVEIEIFSYCNRRCWFCPNAQIDRFSQNIPMGEELYLRIINTLAQVNYNQAISFSRYNEPLADRVILKRLEQARAILPKAMLHTNTNGDFLTGDYVRDLYQHGLNSLKIQVYLSKDEPYDDAAVLIKLKNKAEQIGFPYQIVECKKGLRHEAKIFYQDMNISIYSRNFNIDGCSRGDLVDVRRAFCRTSPCLSPFRDLYIDYNGKVMPCCNLRSDAPEHQDFIVGDLNQQSLFQIYAAGPLVEWRRRLIGFGPKKSPCNNCGFSIQKKNLSYRLAAAKLKFLGGLSQKTD